MIKFEMKKYQEILKLIRAVEGSCIKNFFLLPAIDNRFFLCYRFYFKVVRWEPRECKGFLHLEAVVKTTTLDVFFF